MSVGSVHWGCWGGCEFKTHQSCFPPLLDPADEPPLPPEPLVEVVCGATAFLPEQKLVYQLRMDPSPAGLAVQALSQTPAVPALKAARRLSPQKQAS